MSEIRQREWEFEGEVMRALTVLREIASGETKRGHRRPHEMEAGMRPMKMKEAIIRAKNAAFQLNAAINRFHETERILDKFDVDS